LDSRVSQDVRDLRLSAIGQLNVATDGVSITSGDALGQIWVTYDIELLNPITSVASDTTLNATAIGRNQYSNSGTVSVRGFTTRTETFFDAFTIKYSSETTGTCSQISWTNRPDLVGRVFNVYYSLQAVTPGNYLDSATGAISNPDSGIIISGTPYANGDANYEARRVTFTVSESTGVIQLSQFRWATTANDAYATVIMTTPIGVVS
jgi:hypothetical protein